MGTVDYRGIAGGAVLIAIGSFAALYALANYPMGAVHRMGPGMFPTVLGVIMAGLGIVVLVRSMWQPGEVPRPEMGPFLSVITGMSAFALTIERLGMIPAVFLLTFIVALADRRLSPSTTMILAAGLATIAYVIFRLVLGIRFAAFIWPL